MAVLIPELALVTLTVLFLAYRKKKTPYLYMGLLLLCIFINFIYFGPIDLQLEFSIKALLLMTSIIILAPLFFAADFIMLNMFVKKVLLLDFVYFFKGKVRLEAYWLSLLIAALEELFFRYYLLQEGGHPAIFLIAGSVCFGAVHIVFSKYDMFSKFLLGLFCGAIFLLTNSILLSILFHGIYNYFALKDKTVKSEVVSFGN